MYFYGMEDKEFEKIRRKWRIIRSWFQIIGLIFIVSFGRIILAFFGWHTDHIQGLVVTVFISVAILCPIATYSISEQSLNELDMVDEYEDEKNKEALGL